MLNQKKLGLAGKLAKFFLLNKQFSLVTILALISLGIFSFITMPKQYNPEIVAPAFNITTRFPGASSEEVYELITRPMENKLKEIPQIDKVTSQSLDGGMSIVTVQYFVGENMDNAKVTLREKLASNIDIKPLGANDPQITAIDPEEVPVINIALTSNSYSQASLRKLAFSLERKLKHIPNTSKFEIKGGQHRQLSVLLDEDKLNFFHMSTWQAIRKISQNNLSLPIGRIETGENNFEIKVNGNIQNAHDLAHLIVKKNANGIIYLSDIAQIKYDTGKITQFVSFQTKKISAPAVYLAISKLKGSNAMTVSKNIEKEIKKLQQNFIPQGVDVQIVRDDGKVANKAVMSLTKNLFQSIIIVSIVLLLFLGWKSALVVSISIPLTLSAVFGVGNLFGQTINRITLFALILSLGLLVDNATVVVENIYRLIKKKPTQHRKTTIIEAVNEVGGGLIMSTLTTILAFYPMYFVTGMMGPYMRPIPFFVPAALIASLFIAFSINPYFLDNLFKKNEIKKAKNISLFMQLIEKIKIKYRQLLQILLSQKKARIYFLSLIIFLFLVSVSLPVFKIVKFRMLPKADKQQFYIYLDMPQYTSVEKTNQVSKDIENFLIKDSEIKSIQSYIGQSPVIDFNGLFKGSTGRIGENQATLKINLTKQKNRKETSEKIVIRLRPKILAFLTNEPDAKIKFIEDPPGPPVLSTFLLKIQGDNQKIVSQITRDIENKTLKIKKIVDVETSLNENTFEKTLLINKEKATAVGLNSQQIISTLRILLSGKKIGLYHEKEAISSTPKLEQEYILVQFKSSDYKNFSNLNKIFLTNNQGKKIPLSEVTYISKEPIVPIIYSNNRKKTMYITAEMANRSVAYSVIDALKFLFSYKLPDHQGKITSWSLRQINYQDQKTGETFSIAIGGEWKLTLDVFRDLGIAMGVAIFLIYFVLVAQFKSLKIPLFIMGTIPLALIGVLPGFAILGVTQGMFFNATSMIGVIALAGIVVNNAIILMEYLNEMKEERIPLKEALIDTGTTRLLPILLTSLTTILGSLTIINDPVWAGLAWSIICGLSLSSFLSLVVFPVIYFIFERKDWEKHLLTN